MPTFSSRSLTSNPFVDQIRRRPFLAFGLPFISIIVITSFALENFTKTRYDLNDQKVQTLSKEDALGMSKDRKRVDIREEYYRLNAITSSSTSNEDALNDMKSASSNSTSSSSSSSRKKFSMAPMSQDEYEPVRVPRPAGLPEWGSGPSGEEAPIKGHRKEDRWV